MTRSVAERIADVRALQAAASAIVADRALASALVASTGLSPAGVALALERHLELTATDAELERFVASAGDAARVAVVLSSNVFVGALRALAWAVAASDDVVALPSRRDPIFAQALVAAAALEGLRIEASFDLTTLGEGEIHVYGRDETIAAIRARARVPVRAHGSGMGVAWISARADVATAAGDLAQDIIVFDQRGCLSPRIVLVEGSRAPEFADALHVALEASSIPRGPIPPDERASAARYLTTMTYAGHTLVGSHHAMGVALPATPLVLPPPYRHIHVSPSPSLEAAATQLRPFLPGIVTVGSDDPNASRVLAPNARPAALGRMQRPPLDGPVDRRPT